MRRVASEGLHIGAGPEHVDLDESTPLAESDPNSHPYTRTKAQADKMVLNANKPISEEGAEGLLIACIRLLIVSGEVQILRREYKGLWPGHWMRADGVQDFRKRLCSREAENKNWALR